MQTSYQTHPKPKQWKMLLIAFCFVYIFVNIFYFFLGEILLKFPLYIRTFIIAGIFVPVFGKVIPFLQKCFYKWTIN